MRMSTSTVTTGRPRLSTGSATDLRRITLVAPQGRFDLAMPATVPLAYLVPTLLRQAGEQLADAGVAHGGWVVQRFGGWPLDTAQSAASLGISDGEILYLRPRRSELPTPVFDDAVEAIGVTLAGSTPRWTAAASRTAGLGAAILLLAGGAVGLLAAGPPWRVAAAAAGAAALLLLGAAGMVSRAVGDAVAGAVLGCGAGVYAAVAGLTALANHHASAISANGLLAGSSAALVLVVLAGAIVGEGTPVFTAAAVVAVAGGVAGAVSPHSPVGGGAAAGVCVAFAVTPFVPTIAYRAARLPKPFLPSTAEDLRQGETPAPGEQLAERTLVADRYVSSLLGACAVVSAACMFELVRSPGWGPPTLVAVVCLLALLRTRLFTGRTQRIWLLSAAIAGLVELAIALAWRHPGGGAAACVAAAAVIVAVSVVALATREERTASPPLARFLDITDILAAVAVIPLALEVLGVYGYLRSLSG
jgi:type VII secretion integral membrane protein EccD